MPSVPGVLISTGAHETWLPAVHCMCLLWSCAPSPRNLCPWQIKKYEKLDSEEERATQSRHIFNHYIMKELLACSHVSAVLHHTTPRGVPPQCPHPTSSW